MDDRFNSEDDLDALIMSGDFVMHGLASYTPTTSNWDKMKETIKSVANNLKTTFPNSIILPCFGNNDVIEYYKAPNVDYKD